MAGRQKLQIVVEAVDDASKELKKIGNQVDVLTKEVQKSSHSFGDLTKSVALGSAIYDLAGRAIFALGRHLKDFISDSLETKLSVERLSASLPVLAANSGKTMDEINELIFAIRSENKSMKEAMEITQGIILADLKQADALKLLTTARNVGAAVGRSSAEVNEAILFSLKTLNPGMLKQVGLSVSLRVAYDDMAKALGKNKSELTATEQRQAIFNAAMKEGERFAGAYDAAMNTTSKVLGSVKDAFADVKFAIGGLLDAALFPMVKQTLNAIRTFRAWAFTSNNELSPSIKELAHNIGKVLYAAWQGMIDIVKEVKSNLQSLGRLFDNNSEQADWLARVIFGLGKFFVVLLAILRKIVDDFILVGRVIWNLGNIIYDFISGTSIQWRGWGELVKNIFSGLAAFVSGNFAEAASAMKDAVGLSFGDVSASSQKLKNDLLADSGATSESWKNIWTELVEFVDLKGFQPLAKKSEEATNKALTGIQASMAGASDAIAEASEGASKEVSKIMKTLSDKSNKIKDDIVSAVEKITERIGNLNTQLRETVEQNTRDTLARRTEFGEAFVKQEEKIASIEEQISKETDFVKKVLLEQELVREKAALESVTNLSKIHADNIIEARRRARLTDFERIVEDLEKKRKLAESEFQDKVLKIEMEIAANEEKRNKIVKIAEEMKEQMIEFANARVRHTEASIDIELAKWAEIGRMIDRIVAKKISADKEMAKVAFSETMFAQAFVTKVPKLAEGGIVTKPTLAVVGEAGAEAVVPLKNGFGQGVNVVVNVTGNTLMGGGIRDIAEQIGNIIYEKVNLQLRV